MYINYYLNSNFSWKDISGQALISPNCLWAYILIFSIVNGVIAVNLGLH